MKQKKRLNDYFKKQRDQYSEGCPPKWKDEPPGIIHGDPDTLSDDFDDSKKPSLEIVKSPMKPDSSPA